MIEQFKESILILITTPVYLILIGVEMIMSNLHHKHLYATKDTLTNVYLMTLNMLLDILFRGICLVVLNFFFNYHFFQIDTTWMYWIALLFLQDLAFYFQHRVDHFSRIFWAVHVTHHSSDYFNLTTGFRSSVFQPLYRYIYFIPLVLMGFKAVDIMLMYSITQIYGILIHTQYIDKMGFLEYFMATPSHHRVHHASNIKYLDKNMGMVFIIWDKLFGTFAEEDNSDEPIQFGLTKKLEAPYHPVKVVFHEWTNIKKDLQKPVSFKTKLGYIFNPPGWSHDGSSKTSNELRAELAQRKNSN